jgi:CRP-like cAMP-binding protein
LSAAELEGVAGVATRGEYHRGEIVLASGDERDGMFPIAAGEVRLSRVAPTGREVTIAVLRTGDIFGLTFLAAPRFSRSALVAERTPTVVYGAPQRLLKDILTKYPMVAVRAIEQLGRQVATLADRVEDLALHDTATRLAHALMDMAETEGGQLVVRRTHAEIAAWIGVRPEEVTKQIGVLRRQGIIHMEPRHSGITIFQPDHLKRDQEILANM